MEDFFIYCRIKAQQIAKKYFYVKSLQKKICMK